MKRANWWLGWLAAAVLGFGGVLPEARAETETVDGIPWTYTVSGGKASVGSGQWNGERAVPTTTTGTIAVPATLGGYPVTAIGRAAFRDCAGLTDVTIPDGVTAIGERAFDNCIGLENVAIPASVTNIEGWAFFHCTSLTSVAIPQGVTHISQHAFCRCSTLTRVAIPDSVTHLESGAFRSCSALAEVEIPGSVTNIGDMAFYECSALAGVTIPDGVTHIGVTAFGGCSGLESVMIPDSVQRINSQAFFGCSSLTNVAIGAGVTNIGTGAFSSCSALQAFSVADGNPSYRAASGHLVTKDGRTLLAGRNGEVVIPEGVENIEMYAFQGLDDLTGVTIGEGVTNIERYAFSFCSNLVCATIADSVESIGRYAFYKCSGLRNLEVPAVWYGTGIAADAQWYPANAPVSYRGIDPLAITAAELPAAKEGVPFAAALEVAGGVGPYTWYVGAVRYGESSDESTYAEITSPSAARQWYDAEFSWDVELPFEFPFFGGFYKKAKINSNGAISFGSLPFDWARYDEKMFLWTPFVAAMWESLSMQNGGVFMEEGSGWVKVQWRAAYEEGGAVNFSATLHEDGRIVFSYGAGNKIGGVIGLGAGDGETVLFSKKSAAGRMRNAQDIVFTPVRGMPEWLELTEDGMLRGTPEEGGNLPVTVFVEDAAGVLARKDLTLRVADAVAPTTQRVVFDANGGTCKKTSLTAVVGETYTKLASATWDGHSFLGWYDAREGGNRVRVGDVVSAQSHLNLWARWGRPRQTVHFNANGGTCNKTTVKYFVGDPYSGFAIPTWEGHSFLGWYDAQEGGNRVRVGDVVSDQAEQTLWAHWGGLRQTVRFDANGGACTKTSAKYPIGETYAGFKIPTREGFQFRGWYTAQDGGKRVRNGMTVTEDAERTLYAHWQTTAGSLSITAFSRSSCPVPTVRSTLPPSTEYTLQLETTAGVTLEVQWVPALCGEWSVLNRWTADADGENSISVSLPADSPSGFFRVVEVDAE